MAKSNIRYREGVAQRCKSTGIGLAGGTGQEEGRQGQVRETASECNSQELPGQQATVMPGQPSILPAPRQPRS